MRKIVSQSEQVIRDYQGKKRAQIANSYGHTDDNSAKLITKAELEEQFPTTSHEVYSIQALDKFRKDLMKAEGSEELFKEATRGLKSFVIQNEDKKAIVFVRKKEKGE
jgi:hypothetical protein